MLVRTHYVVECDDKRGWGLEGWKDCLSHQNGERAKEDVVRLQKWYSTKHSFLEFYHHDTNEMSKFKKW